MNKVPESPCVRMCCLDEQDICLGCYRTLVEILEWNTYSAQEKLKVIALCEQRKKARSNKGKD
ncbi:DUF1289 domain-containing protein [Vibrio tetraodonis]|uniref:DUF1289 domain-containing protein n=1 Tax=Vibrio tetraodonis TaxID=2231647 RepID=UPI001F071349|nr:DUF1289 domain-containing protein [Vibrio tetraodonis]